MGACINAEEIKAASSLKRVHSKKTSIENSMEMTNSLKKLRQYEELKSKSVKKRNSINDELTTGIN